MSCSAGFQHVSGGKTAAHSCEACPAGHFKLGRSSFLKSCKTLPLPCVFIAFLRFKTVPFLAVLRLNASDQTRLLPQLQDRVGTGGKGIVEAGGESVSGLTLESCETRCEDTDGCKEGYFDANTASCWIFGSIDGNTPTTCGGETCGSWSTKKCETVSKFTCTEPPAGSKSSAACIPFTVDSCPAGQDLTAGGPLPRCL